jgi:hypothetical protein
VVLGPASWFLKSLLSLLHVLRNPDPAEHRTVADYVLDPFWWDAAGALLMALTVCSAILLYVIVCPPPKDIDQHEA